MIKNDIKILRDLASKVLEISKNERNNEIKKAWTAHNQLEKNSRPMVFIDPENGWGEILPKEVFMCEGELARGYEGFLRSRIYHFDFLKDDFMVDDKIFVPYAKTTTDWGLTEIRHTSGANGAYSWEPPLKDYSMLEKMTLPTVTIDYKKTQENLDEVKDVFNGILDVVASENWWWSLGLTSAVIRFRGLENFMMDMYDCPNELHKLMAKLMEGTINCLHFYEDNKLLSSNTGNTYVGSGAFGFLDSLGHDSPVKLNKMWGFSESQETSSVSPEMYEEFVFPYELEILKLFGLNCYGCCEPLEKKWDIIKKIPNLRRVSVSPWADRQRMAEQLQDKYIFSLKPNPTHLALPNMNEHEARGELKEALTHAKNNKCFLEIIMKDTHTLGKNPKNAIDWVRIAREEINNIY